MSKSHRLWARGASALSAGVLAIAGAFVLINVGASPASAVELMDDGGFEAAASGGNSPWVSDDSEFGTVICSFAGCGNGGGTAAPHAGDGWAWFGGADLVTDHEGYVEQDVTIPQGDATLTFWYMNGAVTEGGDAKLEVKVDDTVVETLEEAATADTAYSQKSVDLSDFADGAEHTVGFYYTDATPNIDEVVNMTVDDVSLDDGATTPPTTEPTTPPTTAPPTTAPPTTAPPTTAPPTTAPTATVPTTPTTAPGSDADGDGVLDGDDKCPTVSSGAARAMASAPGCPNIKQKVSLKFKGGKFKGAVKPAACGAKVKVQIFKAGKGRIAKGKAKGNGKFVIKKSGLKPGKYFAKAKPSLKPATGQCLAGKSKKTKVK